jgi:hypothetical protein
MMSVLQAVIAGIFILPAIFSSKKRSKAIIDTNTTDANYAVDHNGYLVKL